MLFEQQGNRLHKDAARLTQLPLVQAAGGPPLLPSTVAMVLLPKRAGQQYLPSPLRALMDPGSPIASYYDTCDTCQLLSDQLSDATRAVLLVRDPTACAQAVSTARAVR